MRAKFATDKFGYVTLSYDREYGDEVYRIERTFTCPVEGGYVLEWRNGEYRQVCEKLAPIGSVLYCESRDKLLDLIRREYRAMRRKIRRENSYRYR